MPDNHDPSVPRRNDRLGRLGERIMRMALEEHFSREYVHANVLGPEVRGKGPDYVFTDPNRRLAIEVKFWIRSSDSVGGFADFQANILDRLKNHRKKDGWNPQFMMMGKRPPEWSDYVSWSRKNGIQPHFIPYPESDNLDVQVEMPDFDVERYAEAAYYLRLRPSLLKILSLVSEPFAELTDEEWEAVRPLIPWEAMGYSPVWGGGWRMKHRRSRASERDILNGLLQLVSVNGRFRDVLRQYGPWQTAAGRFRLWRGDGTWEGVIEALGIVKYSRQDSRVHLEAANEAAD